MDNLIVSHTLVRNGKPFIDLVLRQVQPYVNRSLVTVSDKSTDGTLQVIRKLEKDFPNKIFVYFENVDTPGELTIERQKQISRTYEDWILFLDDDDYWPESSLKKITQHLDDKVNGYSFKPYQLIDSKNYDYGWKYKYFLKLFRNLPYLNYKGLWPKDLVYVKDELLYWRANKTVPRINIPFIHLSNIKKWSFRKMPGFEEFNEEPVTPLPIPEEIMPDVWKIYEQFNK